MRYSIAFMIGVCGDAKMNALRQKWLGEFQKTLGTKLSVRVMQIDRRLSLAHQAFVTSRIPLAH